MPSFANSGNASLLELCVHIPSPVHSSLRSSSNSPYTSSSSDCDSETDHLSTNSGQPKKKKRQRTTFSPIELWDLEQVYKRRPYLMTEDEEELLQRLGITVRSLKYWFQNRHAKSRKQERELESIHYTSQSNLFQIHVSRFQLQRIPLEGKLSTLQSNQLHQRFPAPSHFTDTSVSEVSSHVLERFNLLLRRRLKYLPTLETIFN